MQGRRDFAFGMGQALQAYNAVAGPKRLWLGLHGHAPSTFPAADTGVMLAEGTKFFDLYLRGLPVSLDPLPVAVSPENWSGSPVRFAAPPKPVSQTLRFAGSTTIDRAGQGAAHVRVRSSARSRSSVRPSRPCRQTRTPAGRASSPSSRRRHPRARRSSSRAAASRRRPGAKSYRIYLSNQATFIPAGSTLTLTVGSSSLAQNPGNLLYLDLPLGPNPKVTVGAIGLSLPTLAKPISR